MILWYFLGIWMYMDVFNFYLAHFSPTFRSCKVHKTRKDRADLFGCGGFSTKLPGFPPLYAPNVWNIYIHFGLDLWLNVGKDSIHSAHLGPQSPLEITKINQAQNKGFTTSCSPEIFFKPTLTSEERNLLELIDSSCIDNHETSSWVKCNVITLDGPAC